MCIHTCMYVRTYIRMYVYVCIHACMYACMYAGTVQLTSKLTLACGNTRVFYFCQVTQSELACDTRVNFRVEHASSISYAARDPSSCAACELVFLCAAHKLTAILYQRRIKAYNEVVH